MQWDGRHVDWEILRRSFLGITKGRKLKGKATVPVPYLRVANVQAGYLNLAEMKEIEATSAEIDTLKLRAGDIVLTEGGDFES